ncbi:MAG: carbon-nitrogen family hydrolase [Candidatus Bathyarchaeia archaeon]
MKEPFVAAVQMNIEIGNKEANLRNAEKLMENDTPSAWLYVLPELFSTGYELKFAEEWAESIPGPTTDVLSMTAKTLGSFVIGSILERRENSKPRNTAIVMDPEGELVAKYSKMHLFRLVEEDVYLSSGDSFCSFETAYGKIGLALCYDLRFPELARHLALDGIQVLLVPAEWPSPRKHPWRTLLQARAVENQFFVIGANRVGSDVKSHYFGSSMVVDPFGNILSEGDDKDGIVKAKLDFSLVQKSRNYITCYQDRRPNLY